MKIYKFYNICSRDTFNEIIDHLDKTSIYKIKYIEDNVEFYSNNVIVNENIKSYKLINAILTKKILPNLIFIISFIMILFVFYTTPYYIREIKYDKDSVQDQIVFDFVEKRLVNHKVEISLNDFSKEMNIKFSHYAFIGLTRRGSVIYLKIEMNDIIFKIPSFENLKGDFVSKYTAYIEKIIIERGTVVTNLNTTVNAGDLLVSGNLKYFNNPNDLSVYTSPKGVIIGRVIEQKSFKINKVNLFKSYVGNYNINNKYYLFNQCINKKNLIYNSNSYIKKDIIFNLLNFFSVVKEVEYLKEDVTFTYDINNIEEYTKSLIYYELEKNRTSDFEKINSIKKVVIIENENDFEVIYLIDKSVNIVTFTQIS